jgi:predicted amidophosphoribosyltransferase
MSGMQSMISVVREGISQLIFPDVCLCCGQEALTGGRLICSFCVQKRFEDANPDNRHSSSGVILPSNVVWQHALWKFDKGGMLQQLMHHLKYERLTEVGTQLGRVLARRVRLNAEVNTVLQKSESVIVPVPLHYLKFKKRGFNQAFYIAKGIASVLDIPICPINSVVRQKFTRSQTGFTLKKRLKNMNGAFRIRTPQLFESKVVIIVDENSKRSRC